jgi:hypothetical protein
VSRYVAIDAGDLSAFLALFPQVVVSVDDPVTSPDAR